MKQMTISQSKPLIRSRIDEAHEAICVECFWGAAETGNGYRASGRSALSHRVHYPTPKPPEFADMIAGVCLWIGFQKTSKAKITTCPRLLLLLLLLGRVALSLQVMTPGCHIVAENGSIAGVYLSQ